MKVPYDQLLEKHLHGSQLKSRLPGFQVGGDTVFLAGKDASDVTKASVRRVLTTVKAKTAVVVAKVAGKCEQLPEHVGYRMSIRIKPTKAKSRIKMGWRERGMLFQRRGFAQSMEAFEPYDGGELPDHLKQRVKRQKKAHEPKIRKLIKESWPMPPDRVKGGYVVSMYLDTSTNHFKVVKEDYCPDTCDGNCNHTQGEVLRFTDQREAIDQYQEYLRSA